MSKLVLVVLVVVAVGAASAVQSHGPAHKEKSPHARKSQKLAEQLFHMQTTHRDQLMDNLASLRRSHKDTAKEWVKSSPPHVVKTMARNLHALYRPSPAISLLEKLSFSKPIAPPNQEPTQEEQVMKEMFGFDDARVAAELERLQKEEPATLVTTSKDEAGFSEEAMQQILAENERATHIAEAPATPTDQLLELGEGSMATSTHKSLDWGKWNDFVMKEFEAARMDGTLDSQAHSLGAVSHETQGSAIAPLVTDLEVEEGAGKDAVVDKMCGCKVALDLVCGSDGETYPSACFAKCAGLVVSHTGPCLDKTAVDDVSSYHTLHVNPNTKQIEMKTGQQTLLMFEDEALSDDLDAFKAPTVAPLQEPGVDFPALSPAEATQEAREATRQRLNAHDIALPFDHVVTHRQFEEDMKELSKVAEEFEPALNDERMAKCECRGDYAPVCGRDFRTYPSACYASCMGVELAHIGVCDGAPNSRAASMDTARDPLCMCSFKKKEVCGVNGKTYVNRCFAMCENVKVREDGPCV